MIKAKNEQTLKEIEFTPADIYLLRIGLSNYMVDLINRVKLNQNLFMTDIYIRRQEEILMLINKLTEIDTPNDEYKPHEYPKND